MHLAIWSAPMHAPATSTGRAGESGDRMAAIDKAEWQAWMRSLGLQVRRVREFVGLSQEQVARTAGVSQGAVSRLEAGRGLGTPLLVILKVRLALTRALVRRPELREDGPGARSASRLGLRPGTPMTATRRRSRPIPTSRWSISIASYPSGTGRRWSRSSERREVAVGRGPQQARQRLGGPAPKVPRSGDGHAVTSARSDSRCRRTDGASPADLLAQLHGLERRDRRVRRRGNGGRRPAGQ